MIVLETFLFFSSQKLRERAFAIYLLSEAISNIIYFNFLLLTRILQRGFQISITNRYDGMCKLRQFDSVWNHVVSLSFFSLATIDRILSLQRSNSKFISNKEYHFDRKYLSFHIVAYRQWSNRIKLAYKMCIACPLLWLLFFGHRLILYSASNGKCGALTGFYASFDSYVEASFTAMGTPIVMIVLGYLLLQSVRSVTHRRIVPHDGRPSIGIAHRSIYHKFDSKLVMMLLLQSAVALVTRLPYAAEVIYSNVTVNWSKSASWIAVDNVIIEVIRLLSYTFFSTSFYISLSSNRGFRQKFKRIWKKTSMIVSTTQ